MNLDFTLEQIDLIKKALREARLYNLSELIHKDTEITERPELKNKIKSYEELHDLIDGAIT